MKEFELEPGEHIVISARKHWLLFVGELLPYAILAILPFALPKLLVLAPPLAPFVSSLDYHSAIGRAVLATYLLIVWTGAWNAFTRYFLDAWIVTNRRIVSIDQRSYFSREVSSLLIVRVQDVTSDVNGVLESFLNIGTIRVQSAGEVDEFIMPGIPRPEQMRNIILRYTDLGATGANPV